MSARYTRTRLSGKVSNIDHYGLSYASTTSENNSNYSAPLDLRPAVLGGNDSFTSNSSHFPNDFRSLNASTAPLNHFSNNKMHEDISEDIDELVKEGPSHTYHHDIEQNASSQIHFANDLSMPLAHNVFEYHGNETPIYKPYDHEVPFAESRKMSKEQQFVCLSPAQKISGTISRLVGPHPHTSLLSNFIKTIKYSAWVIVLMFVSLAAYVTQLNFTFLALSRKFFNQTTKVNMQLISVHSIGKFVLSILLFLIFITIMLAPESTIGRYHWESTSNPDLLPTSSLDNSQKLSELDKAFRKSLNEIKNEFKNDLRNIEIFNELKQNISELELLLQNQRFKDKQNMDSLKDDLDLLKTHFRRLDEIHLDFDKHIELFQEQKQQIEHVTEGVDRLGSIVQQLGEKSQTDSDDSEKLLQVQQLIDTKIVLVEEMIHRVVDELKLTQVSNTVIEQQLARLIEQESLQNQLANQVTSSEAFNSKISHLQQQIDLHLQREKDHPSWETEKLCLSNNLIGDRPDYALSKIGGYVVMSQTGSLPSAHWPNLSKTQRVFNWFKGGLSIRVNHPSIAINSSLIPGDCWAFPGYQAKFTVSVACPVVPTAFTIDHVPKYISLHSESAPRNFTIYAMVLSKDKKKWQKFELLSAEYIVNGNPVQSFELESLSHTAYQYYQLEINSNWGYHYTCLYRFRVHGNPVESCDQTGFCNADKQQQ